jgi:hypothetical protein
VLVLVFAFLVAASPAAAGGSSFSFLPHRAHLSPVERLAYLQRSTRHERQVLAWLRSPAAPATLERPRLIRWHRAALRWHSQLLADAQAKLVPVRWLDAVALVGRYFGADVAAWERSCSQPTSEGGWGRWVPNSQGSGAGGWLQFMSGTFWSVIDKGIARARARGMYVPASARSWYSPLGQAIAGAQMLADGRRGEWSGSGC